MKDLIKKSGIFLKKIKNLTNELQYKKSGIFLTYSRNFSHLLRNFSHLFAPKAASGAVWRKVYYISIRILLFPELFHA